MGRVRGNPSFGNHNNMQVPSELKPAAWGAVGGAIALAVIGFNWGGWVTGGTADKTAKEAADSAIVRVLAPICAEKFQQQADAGVEARRPDEGQRVGERHPCREGRLGDDARCQRAQYRRGARLCRASAKAEGLIANLAGPRCCLASRGACARLECLWDKKGSHCNG